jgi:hypothetical protein
VAAVADALSYIVAATQLYTPLVLLPDRADRVHDRLG